jgi:CubicO group peptidase (beta-lactamase class C family)
MNRRRFLQQSVTAGTAALLPAAPLFAADQNSIDAFIEEKMRRDHIPGVAACIFDAERVIWSKAYGWANIDQRIPMSLDGLQNIASISKTFTTTAIMQLYEAGLLQLDEDLNSILPFVVRNPKRPTDRITVRQLMTHSSFVRDGLSYSRQYACGDPRFSLSVWLEQYFTPGGAFYNAEENFHDWEPDSRFEYTNVSFGILGYIVELKSGIPFPEYCRRNIFSRLGMDNTAWMLADVDLTQHVVPYTWIENTTARGPTWGGIPLGVIREDGPTLDASLADGYQENCVYNHPNYPDGFLRTSVNQLSVYARAYLNGGEFGERRLLKDSSIQAMLTNQNIPGNRKQGLTWYADQEMTGELKWGHGGSDPGSNTDMRLLPAQGVGAIVFANTNGIVPTEISDQLLELGLGLI